MRGLGIVLLGLLLWQTADAATINANSCSRADVNSALTTAQNDDTVVVPAGNCTWTPNITIDQKRLTL